jgi:NDP-sugar pyrophosphorylase family protein
MEWLKSFINREVKAKDILGQQPFLVMNVDILTNLNLKNLRKYEKVC